MCFLFLPSKLTCIPKKNFNKKSFQVKFSFTKPIISLKGIRWNNLALIKIFFLMFLIWDILMYSYRGEKKKEGSSHILEKWKKLMPLVFPPPKPQLLKPSGGIIRIINIFGSPCSNISQLCIPYKTWKLTLGILS